MTKQDSPTKIKAIALCRVSSLEQLKNNSLKTQDKDVHHLAEQYNAELVRVWSGQASSKRGRNLSRKDLKEMIEYCDKHKEIKYLFVTVPDRLARSTEEGFWFVVELRKRGVKIIFSDDKYNSDDSFGNLMRAFGFFAGEASNEERIRKSIHGHEAALKEGRYTFQPPIGYMRGKTAGIHEIDPDFGPYLKYALIGIANGTMTVKGAMSWYNDNCPDILLGKHCKVKMDKWRKWIVNPYYAGVVEMNKQIKVRNEHGLHTPLITMEQHKNIVEAVEGHKRLHKGPKKGGNPRFPLNQLLLCEECRKNGKIFKFTGYDNTNGKTTKKYSRYFCRGCNKSLSRDEAHQQVQETISRLDFSEKGRKAVVKALGNVWSNEEAGIRQELELRKRDITNLSKQRNRLLDQLLDEKNNQLKELYRERLEIITKQITEAESKSKVLEHELERGRSDFIGFALDYIDHMGTHFFELPLEEVAVCKNILFPSGFFVDFNKTIYTPEISPLYRERTKKKDAETSKNALVVGRKGLEPLTSSV